MADQSPAYIQQISALGGLGIITGFLGWLSGHRLSSAQARKTDIEADQIEDAKGAEFERAVNERTKILFEGYELRIQDLTREVHSLREEVSSLRAALNAATRELHEARSSREGFGQ